MKNYLRLTLILLSIMAISCNSKQDQSSDDEAPNDLTTIYLIRHAEKQTGSDPDLTEEGLKRANSWVEYFFIKDVDHVISSDFNRTRQTAAPLAKSKKKEVEIYDVRKMTGNDILEKYKGKTVVLFGHSNTINQYANDLQNDTDFKQLDESVYDKFIIVRADATGNASAQMQTMTN